MNNKILEAIQRGINLAIDDFDDIQDIETQKAGQIKNAFSTKEQLELRKYFVDLGLPSGTLWAKYNVGVNPTKLNSAQDWYGGYYAWGEIEEKQKYTWETYKYANEDKKLTKYCNNARYCDKNIKLDNLITLLVEDDVAVQTNRFPWNIKMPIKEQFEELLGYTTNEWVRNYQGISGLNGRIFTSKTNGNQMFIPAAGYRTGSSVDFVGSYCYLWSCSLYQPAPQCAYSLSFNFTDCYLYTYIRDFGFSARPVLNQ